MMFAPEDDLKMWSFIAENYLNYGPFEIFTKMKEMLGYEHAEKSLYYRFRNILAPNLHFTSFDVNTKLQIAKKFNIVLNGDFVQELNKSWELVFDSNGCLEEFSWKPPFSISSSPSISSEMFVSLTTLKRTSTSSQNGNKKRRRVTSSDDSFMKSLQEMISETVTTSNRKLIEEMRNETNRKETSKNNGVKHYLEGLKHLITHLNTPELNDIEKRIDALNEKMNNEESVPLPVNNIVSMLDIGLKMIGG
ncbi:hypothetical protein GCK72_012028 [Caenorhabditis remanei]|uniref:SPK domain-containing protein n=1 Tax=Caenorhabditis remanei TaxID=31234 RepID=A0A6A5GJZ0_CAERE|nr:hypothetical protein GCK72_012028 [Caenorhabditis remanei]KAF1755578.1 hypothetical protein GCK72_012028 [Caenorhabditis remanei]